jgi:hypothetical protein
VSQRVVSALVLQWMVAAFAGGHHPQVSGKGSASRARSSLEHAKALRVEMAVQHQVRAVPDLNHDPMASRPESLHPIHHRQPTDLEVHDLQIEGYRLATPRVPSERMFSGEVPTRSGLEPTTNGLTVPRTGDS